MAVAGAAAQPPGGPEGGPPPARVAVAEARDGALQPTAAFKGSVYFKEVSNLAAEVSGQVEEVLFEEGDQIAAGTAMVRLDDELLQAEYEAARATASETEARLQRERTRFVRARELLDEQVTTPQEYDDLRFTVGSLEHALSAARAEVERIARQLERKTIYAPFDALVIARDVEVGEWLANGASVAVIARDGLYDVIVNPPEDDLRYIETGQDVTVTVTDTEYTGSIVTIIPQGDVATRTFPVKIRLEGDYPLLQGMSAQVRLPVSTREDVVLVPRDAVLLDRGETVIFTVENGTAQRRPVDVVAYDGLDAGVRGDDVAAGATVVTKGHERLQQGQPVETGGVPEPPVEAQSDPGQEEHAAR
jgi:RND family efflux transporter MFP subunit